MQKSTKISERRACQLVGLSRTVLHYEPKSQPSNEHLQARLTEFAGERRRFGYRRLHALVRREGVRANHKRIYRLYREAGLAVRRRRKRHGVAIERQVLERPAGPNQVWSMDFVSDALANGRRFSARSARPETGQQFTNPHNAPRKSLQNRRYRITLRHRACQIIRLARTSRKLANFKGALAWH